jgi:hypothetical protein
VQMDWNVLPSPMESDWGGGRGRGRGRGAV